MSEPIDDLYFNWLYSKVCSIRAHEPSMSFYKLLSILHRIEYLWLIVGDDNRLEDGLELRTDFLRESRVESEELWLHEGCSVLEMLIAFSRRASFQTDDSPRNWFWEMLENIGLSEFNDATDPDPQSVSDVIETFIFRTYDHNGLGGLFPLRNSQSDQRDVEVWYQFCDYIYEKELG